MTEVTDIREENVWLGRNGNVLAGAAGLVGVAGLAIAGAVAWAQPEQRAHFWASYLVSFCYFLSLGLGALFLVLLEHLARAGWSVVVRRLGEGIVAMLPVLGLLFLPLLWGMGYLYPWVNPSAQTDEHLRHLLEWKRPYLNSGFFALRAVIYLAVWLVISWYYLSRSSRQDATGDPGLTRRLEKLAPVAVILYGLTVTFAAFDWIMSRDPYWYSTIYGVYYFSGGLLGAFALLTVSAVLTQASGRLARAITPEHYQDLGKYTFGFVVFWAYIAFSQYMLIWYGNIPEETQWYALRSHGAWGRVSLLLLFGHFVLPFLGLISRWPKRRKGLLAGWCVWILVMHWVDLYWLVMPEYSGEHVPLSWLDLATFVGIGGLCIATALLWLGRRPLIAVRDPRLAESLVFENA